MRWPEIIIITSLVIVGILSIIHYLMKRNVVKEEKEDTNSVDFIEAMRTRHAFRMEHNHKCVLMVRDNKLYRWYNIVQEWREEPRTVNYYMQYMYEYCEEPKPGITTADLLEPGTCFMLDNEKWVITEPKVARNFVSGGKRKADKTDIPDKIFHTGQEQWLSQAAFRRAKCP